MARLPIIVQAFCHWYVYCASGMMLAGSRRFTHLVEWHPSVLVGSKLVNKNLPNRALVVLSIVAVIVGSVFPFWILSSINYRNISNLYVCNSGHFSLYVSEGKDLPLPAFKLPLYPVMPILIFICVFAVFWGLSDK